MSLRDGAVETAVAVARTAYDHEVQYPAAALAYYAFVSLLPLLVILLAVVREPVAEQVRDAALRFLTPDAQQLVTEALADSSGRVGATLFALVVLVWSAANITTGLRTAVERIEGRNSPSFHGRLRDAAAILGSLGLGTASVVLASGLFALSPAASPLAVGGLVVLLGALTVAFLPLYYVPSRVVTSLATALPGAFTAAVGWVVLLAAIRFYVGNAATYAIYGVLSGILLVLTSLYLAAVVLIVGFVVNATLAETTTVGGSPR